MLLFGVEILGFEVLSKIIFLLERVGCDRQIAIYKIPMWPRNSTQVHLFVLSVNLMHRISNLMHQIHLEHEQMHLGRATVPY